jgi:hypothetical protein
LILSSHAKASYVQVDTNNFTVTDSFGNISNVFLSPQDHSCLLLFTPTCVPTDVGFVTYATSQNIENLVTGNRILELFGEGIFSATAVQGGDYFVLDETGNSNLILKPVFNADFGFLTSGIGAFYYATETPVTTTPAVPVPASLWLFGSGLIGLVGVARRKL